MGQPDLIYRFMDLAHHQAALNSRRGAAFGVANIAKLSGDTRLAGQIDKLIPKLYRYQFDPNPKVQARRPEHHSKDSRIGWLHA